MNTPVGSLNLLIDTGANKNYVNPSKIPPENIRNCNATYVTNISGKFQIDQITKLPIFRNKPPITFNLFKFHKFFDGLIGFETLRTFGAVIDTKNNTLILGNTVIPLKKKFPNYLRIEFNTNETVNKLLPVPIKDGDFYLDHDIYVTPEILIPSGVYTAHENATLFPIINLQNKPATLQFDAEVPISEIFNFEEIHNAPQRIIPNKSISSEIRTSHLNREEKSVLLDAVQEYEDVFYREGDDLSFSNVVKHKIETKDEIPVHSKSYRYPFIHKEEVQRQTADMLSKGIIQPSTSP